MADKTVTVKAAGGDYTSLNAALAGESGILDGVLTIQCFALGADDTTAATIGTGYTTTAANYIKIVGDSSLAMAGLWSESRYVLACAASDAALIISESFVRVEGLQIRVTESGTGSPIGAYYTGIPAGTSDLRIDSCLVKGVCGGTGNGYGIRTADGDAIVSVFNTIINDFVSGTDSGFHGIYVSPGTINVYNSVIHNCRSGFTDAGGTSLIKNSVIFDCNDDLNGVDTIDYCATDDNDGTNNVDETAGGTKTWSDCFTDYSNDDFSLKAGSPLIGAGTNDPSSGLYSDDIAGTARADTWDVGAFEYVAAGGGNVAAITAYYNTMLQKRRLSWLY